jgi:hypothetical protein
MERTAARRCVRKYTALTPPRYEKLHREIKPRVVVDAQRGTRPNPLAIRNAAIN